jgi:hypothetical protein
LEYRPSEGTSFDLYLPLLTNQGEFRMKSDGLHKPEETTGKRIKDNNVESIPRAKCVNNGNLALSRHRNRQERASSHFLQHGTSSSSIVLVMELYIHSLIYGWLEPAALICDVPDLGDFPGSMIAQTKLLEFALFEELIACFECLIKWCTAIWSMQVKNIDAICPNSDKLLFNVASRSAFLCIPGDVPTEAPTIPLANKNRPVG